MSSHYFVKEGQEPALMILDAMPFSAAADLLAWAPLIVVSDRALEAVGTWGIKIDVVFGVSGDQRSNDKLLEDQQPVHIITAADQHSGLRAVFSYLHSMQNSAVVMIADKPEEMISSVDGITDLDITIQDQVLRWSRITHEFHKWLSAGTRFRLFFPEGALPHVEGAEEQNGVFVTTSDGIVSILPHQSFWIGEYF